MSKSKSDTKATKASKSDILSKVKDAGVTKPAQGIKAQSKELAKKVAGKEDKKEKKKKVKEPTPEPSSEEESSEDGASESESESEEEKKAVNHKTNGVNKSAPPHDESEDDSGSDDESESSDSSEDEAPKTVKVNGASKPAAKKDDVASSSEESDSSEDEKPAPAIAKKGVAPTDDSSDDESESDDEDKPGNKAAAAAADVSGESSDESDSDSDASEDLDDARVKSKVTKRKAEEVEVPAAKKTRTEALDTSRGKNLFVGNLSWNVDEAWLREVFEEHGELSGARLMTDRATGRSKGFGYIEFVNAEDAAKAHDAKKGFELDGRALNVDFASGKPDNSQKQDTRRKSYGDQLSEPTDTLFIGNISFDVGPEQVTEAFAPHGTVVAVRLPTDRDSGAPKGFGYVNFASVDEAAAALEAMQGFYLGNRPIRLDYSQPRPQNNDSPGRGRGGGGFGGRGGGGRGGGRGRGGFGGRGGGGGFGARGGRGGGRGGSTNRGGFGDFSGNKQTFAD